MVEREGEDEEIYDCIEDYKVEDFEKRWNLKLRKLPLTMDLNYEYHGDPRLSLSDSLDNVSTQSDSSDDSGILGETYGDLDSPHANVDDDMYADGMYVCDQDGSDEENSGSEEEIEEEEEGDDDEYEMPSSGWCH